MPKKIIHLPRDFKPPPPPELEPDTPFHAAARKVAFGFALLLLPFFWFLILVRFGYRLWTVYRDEPLLGRILAALGMGLATLYMVSNISDRF